MQHEFRTTGRFPRINYTKSMTTLLNPFSYQLKKQATQTINSKSVYSNGDYSVYKYVDKHFIYTYKNIVIAERCGLDKTIVDNLANDTYTGKSEQKYMNFDRPKEAIEIGINAAKELGFTIK